MENNREANNVGVNKEMGKKNVGTLFTEDEFVETYESMQPRTLQSVADRIIEHVRQTRPTDASSGRLRLAVDVGCGTGQNTYVYADHFDRVLGTDVSEQMIRKAVELNTAARPANVEFAVSPAEDLSALGVRDGSVDLLTVAFALHWFDLPKFFAEVRRVLAPGGVLAVLHQKFKPFHPTDNSKTERLIQLKDAISSSTPRGVDPRMRMASSLFSDVQFPLDDVRRECVATVVLQKTVDSLRFCFRNSLLFSAEPPEVADPILDSFQDQLMDIVDEDRGRLGDSRKAVVHLSCLHWVIMCRKNDSTD